MTVSPNIAFSGKPGAGKNTIAEHLADHVADTYGAEHRPHLVAFADAVRDEAAAAYEMAMKHGTGAIPHLAGGFKLHPAQVGTLLGALRGAHASGGIDVRSPAQRIALQELGRLRRIQDPGWWIKRAFVTATKLRLERLAPVFITDLRYPNELECFTVGEHEDPADRWWTVRLECDITVRHERLAARDGYVPGAEDGADSETALDYVRSGFTYRPDTTNATVAETVALLADAIRWWRLGVDVELEQRQAADTADVPVGAGV